MFLRKFGRCDNWPAGFHGRGGCSPAALAAGLSARRVAGDGTIEDFHRLLLYIIVAVSLFVLALLVWIVIRYNHRANPIPSKTAHNTLLEVAWTIMPVIILVVIAIPSFKLLYYEAAIPHARSYDQGDRQAVVLDLRISGAGNFTFDSLGLSDADAAKTGQAAPAGRRQCGRRAGEQGGRKSRPPAPT